MGILRRSLWRCFTALSWLAAAPSVQCICQGFGQENRSHSRRFFSIGTRIHHFCWYRAGRVEGQGSSHYSECVPGAHLESAVIWAVGAAAADLSG